MGKFLRENWIWIVAPIALVIVLMVVVVLMTSGGDDAAPFIYNIF